jgi:hypothetical protein
VETDAVDDAFVEKVGMVQSLFDQDSGRLEAAEKRFDAFPDGTNFSDDFRLVDGLTMEMALKALVELLAARQMSCKNKKS